MYLLAAGLSLVYHGTIDLIGITVVLKGACLSTRYDRVDPKSEMGDPVQQESHPSQSTDISCMH